MLEDLPGDAFVGDEGDQPRLSGNESTNFGNLGRNTFPRSAPTELIDRSIVEVCMVPDVEEVGREAQ